MKKRILLLTLSILGLVSCNKVISKELKGISKSGQYAEITYEEYEEKIAHKEDFVFFLTQKSCETCVDYYKTVSSFIGENEEYKIYSLDISELDTVSQLSLQARIYEVLGASYYESKGYDQYKFYLPTTILVESGRFEYIDLGTIERVDLSKYYKNNFFTLKDYHGYTRKTANNDSFVVFMSKDVDGSDKEKLEGYFKEHSTHKGYFLDLSSLSEADETKLIGRFNYYLESLNIPNLTSLPPRFVLEYEDGVLVLAEGFEYTTENIERVYD